MLRRNLSSSVAAVHPFHTEMSRSRIAFEGKAGLHKICMDKKPLGDNRRKPVHPQRSYTTERDTSVPILEDTETNMQMLTFKNAGISAIALESSLLGLTKIFEEKRIFKLKIS